LLTDFDFVKLPLQTMGIYFCINSASKAAHGATGLPVQPTPKIARLPDNTNIHVKVGGIAGH